jgi:cell division transport system permease protein
MANRTRPRADAWTGPSTAPYTTPATAPAQHLAPMPPRPLQPPSAPPAAPGYGDPHGGQPYGSPPNDPQAGSGLGLEPWTPDADRQARFETTAAPRIDNELRADDRPTGARTAPQLGAGPIVEASNVTSSSLTLVVSIMCFLACLTAGAVYMVNQSASAWLADIASEVTVQIEPKERADTEKTIRDVSQFLSRQPGIKTVRPLSLADSASLIEPWLGQSDALRQLPVPRLVAIEIDRAQPPDMAGLRKAIEAQFGKGVVLDDHRHWQAQIRTVTRSLALGGLAILMLVGAATTAIIVSAARSAMASNREIVEVLHFVGATDRFIAGEFERHFQRLGIRAGLVGAALAMLVFLAMPHAMELLGGGAVTIAELQRLIGTGSLDAMGYGVLVVVVLVIAVLCRLTSRFGVYRILNSPEGTGKR